MPCTVLMLGSPRSRVFGKKSLFTFSKDPYLGYTIAEIDKLRYTNCCIKV